MYEITPSISCVITEKEYYLEDPTWKDYRNVYIICNDGTFRKQINLRGGRSILHGVNELPKVGDGKTKIPKEEVKFLPAGPVPYELYTQAYKFFMDVMKTFNKEHEAMLHILWNPTKGYFISIPEQEVDKASVKYTWDHMGADDMLVVDIHSHNTMSAFFSGTDNKDDHSSVVYSGVFGKLDRDVPHTVWRMNFGGREHVNCTVDEIFAVPMPEPEETPQEWLGKVSEKKPWTSSRYTNGRTSSNHTTTGGSRSTYGRNSSNSNNRNLSHNRRTTNTSTPGNQNKNSSVIYEGNQLFGGVKTTLGSASSPYFFDPISLEFKVANTLREVSPSYVRNLTTADVDPTGVENFTEEEFLACFSLIEESELILLMAIKSLLDDEEAEGGNDISNNGRVLDFNGNVLEHDPINYGLDDDVDEEDDDTVSVDDSSEEEIKAQLLIWYKGLEDDPEAQLEALRSLYEATDSEAQAQLSQTGF